MVASLRPSIDCVLHPQSGLPAAKSLVGRLWPPHGHSPRPRALFASIVVGRRTTQGSATQRVLVRSLHWLSLSNLLQRLPRQALSSDHERDSPETLVNNSKRMVSATLFRSHSRIVLSSAPSRGGSGASAIHFGSVALSHAMLRGGEHRMKSDRERDSACYVLSSCSGPH